MARRRLTWLVLPILMGAAAGARGGCDGGCDPGAYLAAWRAEALGHAIEGHACWVVGTDEVLRLEVALDESGAGPVRSLFQQSGQGWTVVLGEPGQGTFNGWAEAWRQVPPAFETWIRDALLCDGATTGVPVVWRPVPRPRFARRAGEAAVYRWIAPTLALDDRAGNAGSATGSNLRDRLVRRGSGRGADREIARLEVGGPRPAASPWRAGTTMRLGSSRRPGSIRWTILVRRAEIAVPDEVFLPLWPLADFLDPARVFPGTR